MKKDLQVCDSLSVAYEAQKKDFDLLIKTNLSLFNNIESTNNKAELWQKQIKKQEDEITKLQKRKKNRILYIGGGFLAGLILGASL